MNPESILVAWEKDFTSNAALPTAKMSLVLDRGRAGKFCQQVFEQIKPEIVKVANRQLPPIAIDGLSIWDLAAFVGADENQSAYAIGVSTGALRLFDLVNCCRWAEGVDVKPETLSKNREYIWQVFGSVLYQFTTGRYFDLRHWMLDPSLGCIIPYGFIDTRIGSIVHPDLKDVQEYTLRIVVGFIIAHEIGHIIGGHLSGQSNLEVTLLTDLPSKIFVPGIDWNCEYAADEFATKVVMLAFNNHIYGTVGQLSFFFHVLNTVEQISTEPIFWGHSHPSPLQRLEHIREFIKSLPVSFIGEISPAIDKEILLEATHDFDHLTKELAEWIIENPGHFVLRSNTIISDYEEYEPDLDLINKSAVLNNLGDEFLKSGRLEQALSYYEQSMQTITGRTYGEGHRIIYGNLVIVHLQLNEPVKAVKWASEGIRTAISQRDRPGALQIAQRLADGIPPKFSVQITEDDLVPLNLLKYRKDPRLTAIIDQCLIKLKKAGCSSRFFSIFNK